MQQSGVLTKFAPSVMNNTDPYKNRSPHLISGQRILYNQIHITTINNRTDTANPYRPGAVDTARCLASSTIKMVDVAFTEYNYTRHVMVFS